MNDAYCTPKVEDANQFLRECYIAEFNQKFTVPAQERGTAFRKTGRSDLDWIFSLRTERMAARDNTIAFWDQIWQLEKTRWRYSFAGCTVTVHEHLDGRVSMRYDPHVVAMWTAMGSAPSNGYAVEKTKPQTSWKFRYRREISTFPPRQWRRCLQAKGEELSGLTGQIVCE